MSGEFEEILGDGVLPGPYEPIFWLNDDRFKFKVDPDIKSAEFAPEGSSPTKGAVVTRYSRRVYGIGDSPNERKD